MASGWLSSQDTQQRNRGDESAVNGRLNSIGRELVYVPVDNNSLFESIACQLVQPVWTAQRLRVCAASEGLNNAKNYLTPYLQPPQVARWRIDISDFKRDLHWNVYRSTDILRMLSEVLHKKIVVIRSKRPYIAIYGKDGKPVTNETIVIAEIDRQTPEYHSTRMIDARIIQEFQLEPDDVGELTFDDPNEEDYEEINKARMDFEHLDYMEMQDQLPPQPSTFGDSEPIEFQARQEKTIRQRAVMPEERSSSGQSDDLLNDLAEKFAQFATVSRSARRRINSMRIKLEETAPNESIQAQLLQLGREHVPLVASPNNAFEAISMQVDDPELTPQCLRNLVYKTGIRRPTLFQHLAGNRIPEFLRELHMIEDDGYWDPTAADLIFAILSVVARSDIMIIREKDSPLFYPSDTVLDEHTIVLIQTTSVAYYYDSTELSKIKRRLKQENEELGIEEEGDGNGEQGYDLLRSINQDSGKSASRKKPASKGTFKEAFLRPYKLAKNQALKAASKIRKSKHASGIRSRPVPSPLPSTSQDPQQLDYSGPPSTVDLPEDPDEEEADGFGDYLNINLPTDPARRLAPTELEDEEDEDYLTPTFLGLQPPQPGQQTAQDRDPQMPLIPPLPPRRRDNRNDEDEDYEISLPLFLAPQPPRRRH